MTIEIDDYQNWRFEIYNEEDKILFDEIIRCIEIEAYRSASVMIWVLCAESLIERLNDLSDGNNRLKQDLRNYMQNKNEAGLLALCKKYDLINDLEYSQLNSVRESRNNYAHPNFEEPSKNDVLASLYFIINDVLSKPPLYSYTYVKNLIETHILEDPYYLGDKNETQIEEYALEFFNRTDSKFFKSILELLFNQIEDLFDEIDINKHKCLKVGLIFIKTLLIKDNSLLNNIDEFLSVFKKTSCNIFSEEELWNLLDEDNKFKIFNYSFDSEYKIFSEIEFLNKFSVLYVKGLLNEEFKEKIEGFIYQSPADLIFNCSIPKNLLFNKIINDLNDFDYGIQNSIAKYMKILDLKMFEEDELEILGRALFNSVNKGAFESRHLLNYYLYKETDLNIPYSFIRGILFEIFVNNDDEFMFKERYSKLVLKKVLNNDNYRSLVDDLLNLIENSNVKTNNFDDYEFALNKLVSFMKESEINRLDDLINSIKKSRCHNINKIFEKDNYFLLDISNYNKENILPHLFNCFDEGNKEKFINISKENIFIFIEFFSDIVTSINKNQIKSIDIKYEFLEEFIDLNNLKIVVEDSLTKDLSPREAIIGKFYIDSFNDFYKK